MEKIKVLQISKLYYPWLGGVEKVVQGIAEGLNDRVDMEVLVCQPKGWGSNLLINGVRVTKAGSIGIYWSMPVSFSFPFLLARKSGKADIVHFHFPFPIGDLSYLFAGPRRPKIVITYHSDIVKQEKLMRFYRPFLRRFLKWADVILPTSPKLVESSEHLKPYKDKCVVVPLSIDLQEFGHPVKQKFDLGISSDEKIILFVGRLSYYKGLEYLIEAMQEVEAKLLIAGEGGLRGNLEAKARSLGVNHKVIFLGKVTDEKLKYCYQTCAFLVLPSVAPSEAFAIVQLEAMAYGKPVINTRLPTGVPYVSVDGETGITVEPKNSRALAEAINKLLKNAELLKMYGAQARRRVEEHFTTQRMNEKILEVYRGLVGK